MTTEAKAPAKVNLFLDVLGKRTDGYHDIRSLLAPVSLFDRITIEERRDGVETTLRGGGVKLDGIPWPATMPDSEDNLATRAARMLKAATGYPGGSRICIEKNIPVAGGLGGGSSDAATTLRELNAAWKTGLSTNELMTLGASLGSDIPAMVHGGTVCMEGRGELITPVAAAPGRPVWMLLVNPGLEISTADIYSRYAPGLTSPNADDKFSSIMSGLREGCPESIGNGLFNRLQKTALCKYPLLRIIKNELEKAGALGVLLSGTGSTVLALVRGKQHALDVQERFRKAICCPAWTCIVKTT